MSRKRPEPAYQWLGFPLIPLLQFQLIKSGSRVYQIRSAGNRCEPPKLIFTSSINNLKELKRHILFCDNLLIITDVDGRPRCVGCLFKVNSGYFCHV